MKKSFSKYSIIVFFIALISLLNIQYIYAATLSEEAESYREKGYKAQEKGDIDMAISWYQKSAELDSSYAAPHNDLGILFEAKGLLDRAEGEYLKALAINDNYEKAHTNLALLYERKGELEKAAFHWMRRYKLGKPGDPWTGEARQRLEKLGLIGEGKLKPEKKIEQEPSRKSKKKSLKKLKKEKVKKESPEEEELKKKWLGEKVYEKKKSKKDKRLEQEKLKEEKRKKRLKKRKPKKEKVKEKPKDKEEVRGKIRKLKSKTKPIKKEKGSKWTRVGAEKPAKKKLARKTRAKKDISEKLQKALELAEQRLRDEKSGAPAKAIKTKKSNVKTKPSPVGTKSYREAKAYYNKGEYSKALDIIRTAKRGSPKEKSLLYLEDQIKNRMKEERIKDYYKEGISHYRKNDFSSARKEFEAILNILPE